MNSINNINNNNITERENPMDSTSHDNEKNLNQYNRNIGVNAMINNNFKTKQKNEANNVSYIYEERPKVPEFAELIRNTRNYKNTIPSKKLINFRDWALTKIEQEVYFVPIENLRFRSNNGRIASDVMTYEKQYGPIDETKAEDQKILGNMLGKKDLAANDTLKISIDSIGQLEPAIITVDGFLIDGNRRKYNFSELAKENPHEAKHQFMTVIILPDDVTNFEIQQLENHYQLQKDGKSEYSHFDQALTIKKNIDLGMTLEEILAADPSNGKPSSEKFKRAIAKTKNDLLGPLQRLEEFLEQIGQPGKYTYISDNENWQAFVDYHKSVHERISSEKKRFKLGIAEDEIGDIKNVTNKIIRCGGVKNQQLHKTIRAIPKILENPDAKKEFLKINDLVPDTLPDDKQFNPSGEKYSDDQKEKIYKKRNESAINKHLRISQRIVDGDEDEQTPIALVKEAGKKLTHKNMNIENICNASLKELMSELNNVIEAAEKLHQEADHLRQKEVK